ncbi:hypothetical protein CBJ60_004481 [Salmonella enterica subsp. enterica serovar Ajiobo]|nr:hypothetical protein [Salmonella enterica subsp. enterica serovar Ajiobo]EDN5730271.1 hypothetical protein [Salmonella enterica subsp. enterica serovar Ajiobo]EEE8136215.1 hypothetical protein [Salmonella enterica subsp. enterica serovar Ajiobo]
MSETFSCVLHQDFAELRESSTATVTPLARKNFEDLIPRRQRGKLPVASRIAGGIWQHYNLSLGLSMLDSDPKETPLLILNRYANWDYVADMICNDVAVTLESVNSYVATAWFPASLQGYLTIEQGNRAEAITLATKDIDMQAAAIEGLFLRNLQGEKVGAVVVGTFESIPEKLGRHCIVHGKPIAFGAFSLISSQDSETAIIAALTIHQELYHHDNQ